MSSLFWLIVAIITGIVEVVTLSLVSVWFSLSALILAVLSMYVKNLYTQILIFAILSLIFLIFTRSLVKKYLFKSTFDSSFVGTKVRVEEKEQDYYLVKFKGVLYKAISTKELEIGSYVIIKKFSGNKIVLED